MQENKQSLEELNEIKSLMIKSTRFLSLSGLSGVSAGIVALICSYIAFIILGDDSVLRSVDYDAPVIQKYRWISIDSVKLLVVDGVVALFLAIVFGFYFTWRKARKSQQKVFTSIAFRMITNLAIPLFVGGVFALAALYYKDYYLIAPLTLIFYGLAIVPPKIRTAV
jgi:phosphoribosylaminoimidazole (AIR) synthetase